MAKRQQTEVVPQTSKHKFAKTEGKMATTPREHHPHESRRQTKATKRAREQHGQRVKCALQELVQRFKGIKNEQKKESFREWCISHAEQLFPGIGTIAYSVPPFFFNAYTVKHIPNTGFLKRTRAPEKRDGQEDDSDVRGDSAQRLVGRTFRLLNNMLERTGEETMFIVGNCRYENMFKWLEGGKKTAAVVAGLKIPGVHCLKSSGKTRYFQTPKDADVDRHEADLVVIHPRKGVIFVQGVTNKAAVDKRIQEELDQLQKDNDVFRKIMEHSDLGRKCPCHFVLALPNISNIKEMEALKNQGKLVLKDRTKVTLLLKENLFTDDIQKAERDYDLRKFKGWWDELTEQPVDEGFMKDMIARYFGEISTPREYSDTSERSHVRNLSDAIRLTGKLFKRLVISADHEKKVDFAIKLAHVKGPPGSGRTTTLIKKAEHFLKESSTHHVIVLDFYRGVAGTPVGHDIFNSIRETDSKRTHLVEIDVNQQDATNKLRTQKLSPSDTLFIVDEVLPEQFLACYMEILTSDFHGCEVWCADGIVSIKAASCLPGCTSVELNHILRIPTSVQCVLYHADWDTERKELYKADTEHQLEVPTNGPSPVSVRHQGHKNPHLKITECEQCADELSDLLKDKMKLVEGDSSSGGASAAPSVSLPCSIAILYSIPSEHYSELGEGKTDQVETTVDKFNAYQKYIDDCPFVKQLQSRGLPIHNVLLGDMDLQNEGLWDNILVSWVDTFQGLERDVVVFLPGDGPSSTKTDPPEGPTTRAKAKATISEGDQKPGPSGSTSAPDSEAGGPSSVGKGASHVTARKIPVPGLAKTAKKATSVRTKADVGPSPGHHVDAAKSSGGGAQAPSDDPYAQLRMAKYYWSVKDVQRYTDWDKTNLVFAATRCTAQLILLVP